MATFGQIKVANKVGDATTFTFKSRTLYGKALRELTAKGFTVTDSFWGYTLYDTLDKVMQDANFWCKEIAT